VSASPAAEQPERVDPNQAYSATEVERMMKLQDVLLKTMAGKMRCCGAAEIIGVSCTELRFQSYVSKRTD